MRRRYQAVTCQALSVQGARCTSTNAYPMHYHGSEELYSWPGPEPTWVRVYLCAKHGGLTQGQKRAEARRRKAEGM